MSGSLPRPEVIITHESDLDGLVAGVLLQRLARKLFNFECLLEAYHYNNWKQRELRERAGWVTDLSFEARLDRPNWAVIDHHVTEVAPKNALLIHDIGKSAGLLCYELCKQQGLASPVLDHPLLEVMAVKRRVEDPLGLAWSRSNVTEITPTVGFVDTVIGNNNLIVHQLLEQEATKFPVLLTLFRRTNGV